MESSSCRFRKTCRFKACRPVSIFILDIRKLVYARMESGSGNGDSEVQRKCLSFSISWMDLKHQIRSRF
ncbi:unnamed protein product [Lactuca virosa]|uniref:Uncharacterized protein n=1 Tax=Lactuca virosa TaxID=75947 RepID=A0AAU9PAN8_9ASTR|nr:unnamed protein product [Lactuca virosa]